MAHSYTSMSKAHRYNGVLDATLKIIDEGRIDDQLKQKSRLERLRDKLRGIRNLYKGGFVFGMSYTAYMAVQFSLFESILLYLEKDAYSAALSSE